MRFPQANTPAPKSYEQARPHPWLWLLNIMKPMWPLVIVASVAVVGAAASMLGIARGAQYLVDKSLTDPSGHTLNLSLFFMMACAVIMAVSGYFRATTVNHVSTAVGAHIRKLVFEHMLGLDTQFHGKNSAGDLVSRLGIEIGQIQNVINTAIPNGVRNGLLLLGAGILMVATSWHLSLLTLLAVPMLSVPIMLIAPRLRGYYKAMNEIYSDIIAFLTERLAAVRTIQLFAAEDNLNKELAVIHDEIEQRHVKLFKLRGVLTAIIIVLVFSLIAFILWSGGRQVLEGRMTQGEVAAFVMYSIIAAGSLATLMEMGQAMGQARAAIERLIDILGQSPVITLPAMPVSTPADVPEIRFENVTFAYPHVTQPVLKNVSFTIAPRESIALVGPSGAGKSTIFALLTRFYDPQEGRVLLNGADIKDMDPRALRRLFGVIPQEPDIFALSVADNIAFGLQEMPNDQIEAAAAQANIAAAITEMEHTYATVLGERGLGLSVGQKQRLAIARALVREPKVLLMDEATSALDAESERLVQQALHEASKDRTAIVIAHRLATIRNAGRILVMEKGQVVTSGTHDELMAQGGLYAHLAGLQFLA